MGTMTDQSDLRWRIATQELCHRKEVERDLEFYSGDHAPGFASREAHLRLLRTALALYEELRREKDPDE